MKKYGGDEMEPKEKENYLIKSRTGEFWTTKAYLNKVKDALIKKILLLTKNQI